MTVKFEAFNTIAIRARAAFYLAITESLFCAIQKEDVGYTQVREGLDTCWQWVEGEKIDPDNLYVLFANEDTVDVVSTASSVKDPIKAPAWDTAVTSMYYVIWQAYKAQGEKYLPADVEEVNEAMINDHLEYARRSPIFQEGWLENLMQYLSDHYAASNPDELGAPVSRTEIVTFIENDGF